MNDCFLSLWLAPPCLYLYILLSLCEHFTSEEELLEHCFQPFCLFRINLKIKIYVICVRVCLKYLKILSKKFLSHVGQENPTFFQKFPTLKKLKTPKFLNCSKNPDLRQKPRQRGRFAKVRV